MPTSTTTESCVLNSPGRDNHQKDPPAARQHPVGGLAAQADDGAEGVLTQCPFCGGTIQRYEILDSGGERAASLCCGIAQEFLDNYDVYRALPEPLQEVAIARKQAEYEQMEAKSRENARRFRECVERYDAKLKHLRQEVRDGYQGP